MGGRGTNLRFGAKYFVNAIGGKILKPCVLERMRIIRVNDENN